MAEWPRFETVFNNFRAFLRACDRTPPDATRRDPTNLPRIAFPRIITIVVVRFFFARVIVTFPYVAFLAIRNLAAVRKTRYSQTQFLLPRC